MTFREIRDHKFKILFMCEFAKDDIDRILLNYFENMPYEEDDDENDYINDSSKSHKNIAKVKVKVSVPEKEIASFNPIAGRGKGVTITAEALGGKTFHSNYFVRNVQGDVLTHTYDVRFTVLNPGGELLPGMVVNVTTEADQTDADNTVTVPVRCVQQGADGHQFVWLVKGDKAHRQSVEIGQTQGDRIVILSGLAEGDKIIVEGYQKVSEGSQVI